MNKIKATQLPKTISYSGINVFNSCERNFYYSYIAKFTREEETMTAYADAGTVVHETLEHCYNKSEEEVKIFFDKMWEEKKLLTTNKGMFGKLLKKEDYWISVLRGINKNYKIEKFEEKLTIDDSHIIKGFLDVRAEPEEHRFTEKDKKIILQNPELYMDCIVVDWKTNSKVDKESHFKQMQFYAYLWYRKYKKLPKKFIWEYIKIDKKLERVMTMQDVYEVRNKIQKFIDDIYSKKDFKDWKPSPDGVKTNCSSGDCFFCSYKNRCRNESIGEGDEHFKLIIRKGKIYFGNQTSPMFNKVIDKYFSYEIPNKEFVCRAVLKKTGRQWDGIVHMKKYGSYPLGLLNKLIEHINEYAQATGKKCKITIEDQRKDFPETEEFADKLSGLDLRYYQDEAVTAALKEKFGIIACPTSSGKTVIAAEMFRRKPTKTLFVVDRSVLLNQTIKEFEETLPGLKDNIGIITAGEMELKGNFTVATIQTIHSRVKKKDKEILKYLEDVEMIISDEAHINKASQYDSLFGRAINSKIRIGLTGTPEVDAQNALELHKNVGYVCYHIPIQTLIEEGTVMRPTIDFLKYEKGFIMEGDFHDIHEQLIQHKNRNEKIVEVCTKNEDKVIMILVHRIAHGTKLQEMLKEKGVESFFIQGSVTDKQREEILDDARSGHNRVLIGTSQIVSKGLNLKSLQIVINATGNATSIMTIQSLGRVLRTNEGKTSAHFYDFYDEMDYFKDHTKQRIEAFKKEGHKVLIDGN